MDPNIVEEKKPKNYSQYFLPGAILLAAIIVSAALIFTRDRTGNKNTAQIGAGQSSVVDMKIGSGDHILGDKNAKVTFVEFADFRCPFCERHYQQAGKQLLDEYVSTGKVRLVFKNYAFLGQQSFWASEAAECAADQNKYWEMYNWLFANQAPESDLAYYSKENLIKYAEKIVSDKNQFAQCLNSDKYQKKISDDRSQGTEAGISGTPSFLVVRGNNYKFDVGYIKSQLQLGQVSVALPNGNIFIVGAQPYEIFKTAIVNALK